MNRKTSFILLVVFSATLAEGFTGRFDHGQHPTVPDEDLKFHKDLRVHRKAHIKTQNSKVSFEHHRMEFEKFKRMHGKSYDSLEEEQMRFGHFMNNLKKIEQHNSERHSWKMGVTKFADLSKYFCQALKSPNKN